MFFFICHRVFPSENNLPDVIARRIMHAKKQATSVPTILTADIPQFFKPPF
jgi:hypothetical protein